MKVNELEKDAIITEWLDTLNAKPNTARTYLLAMQHYTEYTGMTPGELLKEAEEDIRAGKLPRERAIKKHLVGYRKHLFDKGIAALSVKGYQTGVRSFYKVFDIELPTLPRAGNKAQTLERHNKIPSKEDIQEVLKVCDPLEKALILAGVSSGLAANELSNLKVGQFKKGYDPDTGITTLVLRRGKVGYDFVTFFSPEASKAVWDYLNFRNRPTAANGVLRRQQREKQFVTSDNDYLFIHRWMCDEYLDTYNDELRALKGEAIGVIYRQLSEKAAKCAPAGHWNLIRSHNMRKYYNSAMLNAGADSFFVEFTMGHTLDDTRSAYFRASPDKMREIYSKYVPYLTIQKELDLSESPEYLATVAQNEILTKVNAENVVKMERMAQLETKIKEMERQQEAIGALMKLVNENPILQETLFKKQKEEG